ncbi:MAG: hypothetical protein M3331_08135 [Actinomycetota bacterium]|nr:hypothetical protein [Actinomycetota bacterium]
MLPSALRPRLAQAGCLVFLSVAFASCGGEDEEGGFSPVVSEPLSKVEFLQQADQICASTESQIEAAADDLLTGKGDPPPEEVERVALDLVVPALETEVSAIGALGAPEGDEEKVQAILDATEAGIAEIEADPRALLDGVPESLQEAEQLAREYGSRQCGIR